MIVTEFEIDHFRGRNSLRLLDLGNGLNVTIVGNRVDKTAMQSVIPYVLYGTVADDAPKWVDSIDTDAGLVVRTDNGVFRIDRRVDEPEEVLIRSPEGMSVDPSYLETLVDGVGARTFFATFTLNSRGLRRQLDRRRRHVAETIETMAKFLRDASPQPESAVPRVSLKPLEEMDSCVSQLKRAIGSQAEIERDHLRRLAELPSRDQLNVEIKRMDHELTDAQAKEQRVIRALEDTRLAITFHQLRVRLTAIDVDLAKLREAPTKHHAIPKTDAEIAAIDERLRRCRERLEQLREQQRETSDTLDGDERADRTRRMIPRVEAVLLQEKFVATEEQSIEQLADTIRDLESRIESDRMTADSDAAELAAEAERAAQSLGDIDRLSAQVKEAKRHFQMSRKRAKPKAAVPKVSDLTAPSRPVPTESQAIQEAEQTVKRLRERIGVERDLGALVSERDELEGQLSRLYGQHLPPLPMLMMLGIPFALGAAMILNGFYRYDPVNLQLMGMGAVILIVTSLIKFSTDNVNGDQLFQIRNQMTDLGQEIDEAEAFREEFDREWPDTIRPWRDQLEYSERRLGLLRGELEGSDSRRPAVDPAAAETPHRASANSRLRRQRLNEARQRYHDAMARWQKLLVEIGLPTNMSPSQARLALEQKVIESQTASPLPSSALEFQLRQLRNDLDRRRKSLAEIMGKSRQLVQELGYSRNGTAVGEQMEILRETLQEHRETEKERAELNARLGDLKVREEKLQRYGRQSKRERTELQEQRNKRLDADKAQQQLRVERAQLLERERDQLLQQIEGISLEEADDASVAALSELTYAQLEERLHDLQNQQQDVQAGVVGLVDRRARVHERLKQIEDLEKRVPPDASWNELLATTDDLTQRWQSASRVQQIQTKSLASHLKQAETYKYLQLAAENGSLLADYAVDMTFDDKGELRVLSTSGKWNTLRRLNQHRLSQLYISLWLARIQEFADRGVKMPVVLDDALSLAPRAGERLAMLLRDFAARGHQLLLTTSNRKHAEIFAGLEVPIADLADRETVIARDEEPTPSLTADA